MSDRSSNPDNDLIKGDPEDYWRRMTEWLKTMPKDNEQPTAKNQCKEHRGLTIAIDGEEMCPFCEITHLRTQVAARDRTLALKRDADETVPSRSVQRRVAAMKGEPAPTFETAAVQDDSVYCKRIRSCAHRYVHKETGVCLGCGLVPPEKTAARIPGWCDLCGHPTHEHIGKQCPSSSEKPSL